MKLGKTGATIEAAVNSGINFEVTIADIARGSERRAWLVAWCAVALALILAGGCFFLFPLKEKVPYLVMADAYTGTSTVARLRDDFQNRSVTTSEVVNRSNIAHYILGREAYDAALIGMRDWVTVYAMSSGDVATGFKALHAQNNPNAPRVVYGKNKAIRVKILSIVLIGGSEGSPPRGATVRFQRRLYDKASGSSRPLDSKIATLEFTYKNNLGLSDEARIENPLGFQVSTYRVDTDYATAVPEEVPEAPAPSPQGNQVPAEPSQAPTAPISAEAQP